MNSDTDSINTLQEENDHETITLEGIEDIDIDIDIETEDGDTNDKKIKIFPISEEYSKYYSNTKKTSPFLTKFEKTKIIGIRAQMIAKGSQPVINVPSHIIDAIDIAELEFEKKCIPLFIKRYITATEYEIWRPEDMV